jgi:hypothetical protein
MTAVGTSGRAWMATAGYAERVLTRLATCEHNTYQAVID